jgi:MoaA/NifB/PqqE/SkfB family radical SAM enzyme
MPYNMRRLVIKPTLECTACCPTCALRLDLYEQRKREQSLSLAQWTDAIEDARRLGCTDLHISGGEPSLYPHLVKLIETATRLGMTTNVNTNGSPVSPELAHSLADAGLDSITVSMYSCRADLHDWARQEAGLFGQAIEAIGYLQARPGLLVDLQTILARYNVLEFDRFVEMAYQLRVGYVYVSYVEGDVEKRWLPTGEQIQRFRAEITPGAQAIIRRHAPAELKGEALARVESIFGDTPQQWERFSSGIYHPGQKPACPRPYNFALVLVNGEVHPCNGVEYSHEPVMGNLHESGLADLWQNAVWERFRLERHDWCHRCPMTLHFRIPIMGNAR